MDLVLIDTSNFAMLFFAYVSARDGQVSAFDQSQARLTVS
jgi:hypothetical protein